MSFKKIIVVVFLLMMAGNLLAQPPTLKTYRLPVDTVEPIFNLLDQAQSTIQICAYVITDARYLTAIQEAVNRGVQVTVLMNSIQAKRNTNAKFAQLMKMEVVAVRVSKYAVKGENIDLQISDFGIIDGQTVYMGGAYLHTDMLANPKLGTYIIFENDPAISEYYKKYFEELLKANKKN